MREDSSHGGRSLQEFELPEAHFEDDLKGSLYQQFKRWALETVFGRPTQQVWREGDASIASMSRSAAGGPTYGRSLTSTNYNTSTGRLLRRTDAVLAPGSAARRARFIVQPDNGWLLLWEQLILVLAAYSAIITPFEFAYFTIVPESLMWIDVGVNFFFFTDMVLTFFVAFKDTKTYVYVNDHKRIALRYLQTFFAWDLISIVPWANCYKLAGGGTGAVEILRWMMWLRVLRARHVLNYFRKLQRDIRLSYFAVRIVKLIMVEMYITHVAGCIFYWLATTYPPEQEDLTWIGSLTLGGFSYANFRELPLYERYVTSLYWSVVTMATIGYGDIHPVNPREMIFAMIYITFDLILSAYLVGNITALVVKGSSTTKYREKMAALIKYMNRNHLPHYLRHQMRQHVRLQFETEQVEDEILNEFPISIRHKVSRALFKRVVEDCYLFNNCSPEFISQIVARAVPEYYFPSEVVVLQRDAPDHMYIVCSGLLEEEHPVHATAATAAQQQLEREVSLLDKEGGESKMARTELYLGNAFGEVAMLCNIPQPFTVTVRELSQVLRIDKDMLQSVISMFIIDGRQIVDNLLQRTNEEGSKFAALSSEIRTLIAQQEAELTMTTIYAASRGDIEHLKQLIKAGANPSKADYDGRSPLHLAAAGGYDEVVRFLILEGADVSCRDNFGTTPLLEALRAGHDSTATIIMEKGGSVSLQEAGTDLCNAVINGDTGLLQRLLKHGVDPNSADYDLRTPLHIASAEGFLQVSKLLVENGADVTARDRWGNTPLDEARRCGSLPLVRFLEDAMAKRQQGAADAVTEAIALRSPSPPAVVGAMVPPEMPAAAPVAAEAEADSSESASSAAATAAAAVATAAAVASAAVGVNSGGLSDATAAATDGSDATMQSKSPPISSSLEAKLPSPPAAATAASNSVAASPFAPSSPASAAFPLHGASVNVPSRPMSSGGTSPRLPQSGQGSPSRMWRAGAAPGMRRAPRYGGTSSSSGGMPDYVRKRITVYPFPPWRSQQRRIGRVMWLPATLPELVEAARAAFGLEGLSRVFSADGGELDSLDLILDGDRLFLASESDIAEENQRG